MVIFLALQLSRTWAVDGLCRLAWRSLREAVFVFEGSCDLEGTPVAGDAAARAHLREDLRRRLAFWRRVGMLKVVCSICLPLLLFFPLVRLRRDVAYDPH